VGAYLRILLTVGSCVGSTSVSSTLSLAFSYDAPTVTGGNPSNMPPAGGQARSSWSQVRVVGHGFGSSADYSLRARLGSTACEAVAWLSDTSLLSLVAAGARQGLGASVTVARKYVRSWVDQDNRRFDDVLLSLLLRTVTGMLSCDEQTATTTLHCNTLLHTAPQTLQHTRCNTLQHIAIHCNTLQHRDLFDALV